MTFTRFPGLTRRRLLMGLAAASLYSAGPTGLSRALAGTAVKRAPGGVTALAFEQGRLVLAADDIWLSPDGGANFMPTSEKPGSVVTALAAHPDHPGMIYAATTTGGLLRSVDAERSWQAVGTGLPQAPLDAVAIAAHDPATVYVAVRGDGLWQSKDGAQSWEFAMDRPLEGKVERDVVSLASVGILSGMGGIWVFAGTEAGVARVPDCFCRWSGLGKDVAMDALASGPKAVAAAAARHLPREPVRSLALAPSVPDVLFAALPSGIWKTDDTGETWTLVTAALASPCLAVNPNDPNHIVAADAGGTMLSSRDGGFTWAAPAAV